MPMKRPAPRGTAPDPPVPTPEHRRTFYWSARTLRVDFFYKDGLLGRTEDVLNVDQQRSIVADDEYRELIVQLLNEHFDNEVSVDVPPPEHRVGIRATVFWDLFGLELTAARQALGDDKALGIYLSRGTRELRRLLGADEAATVMRGFADTMHEAAKSDLPEGEPK